MSQIFLLPSTSGRVEGRGPLRLQPCAFHPIWHRANQAKAFVSTEARSSSNYHKARRRRPHSITARCEGHESLEQSVQQGLVAQEKRDAENLRYAQQYKEQNKEIEELAAEVRNRLKGTSIYLVGMMGSGKSTVGKLVARTLQYPFLDSDQIAEAHADTKIADIFESEGEEAFRDLESAVLQELMPFRSCVIATGGGAVTRRKNWGYMHHGIVAWLSGTPELLARRACQEGVSSRPLLGRSGEETGASEEEQIEATRQKLTAILDKRKDLYAQADMTVPLHDFDGNPSGAPVSVVAYRLLKALNDRLKQDVKEEPGPEFKGFGKRP